MNSPQSSVVVNENVLEQALRTYEESERSLKSVCNSVEQENNQLENQLTILENEQTKLIKQYHLLKERIHQIRGEHARLAEKQLIFDQQNKLFHQRYEQVQSALKKVLSSSILTNVNVCEETFSLLGFKLIPIDQQKHLTKDIGTNYDPPSFNNNYKRKFNQTDETHHKKHSHPQRSSK